MDENKERSVGNKILVASGVGIAGIVALFLLICLMGFVVIGILALLGPQIGNVFSQINAGLTTPMP